MRTRSIVQLVCCLAVALAGLTACGPNNGGSQGPQCTKNSDCKEGQTCEVGTCFNSCEKDADCNSGSECRLGGLCVKPCEDGGSKCGSGMKCSKAAGVCWPEGNEIASCEDGDDTQCEPNEYCGNGACLPIGCEKDADCAGRNICQNGQCRTGCRKDEDCSGSKICDSANTCVIPGCAGPNESCTEHQRCKKDVNPSRCVFTGDCDEESDDSICEAYAEQQNAKVPYHCDVKQGKCTVKPECKDDSDCEDDELCIEAQDPMGRNSCVEGCRCTKKEDCDRPCPPGDVCNPNQKCEPGCRGDDDCGMDEVCVGGKCLLSCQGPRDCEYHLQKDCKNDSDCPGLDVCDQAEGKCKKKGLVCRTTSGESVCQECNKSNQCPATKQCDTSLGRLEDDSTGLCADKPPECPKDGYMDNHHLQGAVTLKKSQLPFKATGGMNESKPSICSNAASNPNYTHNNGEWWKFAAEQGKVIDVTIRYDEKAGNLDLKLLNSNGNTLISSVRPPGSDPGKERIVYGVPAKDNFFVQITSQLPSDTPSLKYELEIDVRKPGDCGMNDDMKEENDTRQDAASLSPSMSTSQYIVCGDDKDFYELDAKANQNVTVTVTDVPKRLGDIDIRLVDPQTGNTKLVRNDNGGTLELNYSTSPASKLILEVRFAGGAPGKVKYGLKWTQSPNKCHDQFEENDVCPKEAHQLKRSTQMKKTYKNLAICKEGKETDFYAIDLFQGDTIDLTSVYTSKGNGLMTMTLFGPNDCARKAAAASETKLMSGKRELAISYKVPSGKSGTYYININQPQGPNPVPHNLSLKINPGQKCQDDGFEDNDSKSGGTSLSRSNVTSGGRDSALIGQQICENDEDWYCLDANSGDDLRWEVKFDNSQGNLDAAIIDPSGNQVTSSTSGSDNETVKVSGTNAGTYCVKVFHQNVTRNDYDLLTFVNNQGTADPQCPDIHENNDSCSSSNMCSAASPAVDQTTKGLLSCSGDDDWYKTCLKAGESMSVSAKFRDTDGNIDMHIYEEGDVQSRTTVPGTDGTTTNNDETVSVYSSKKQCYYYNVSLASGTRNDYDLDVQTSGPPACPEDNDEDNDSRSGATRVQAPGLYVTRRKCEGDVDWYKFDLNSGEKFEAFANFDQDLGDIDLELYKQGNSSPTDSSTSTNDDESVSVSSPSGTTYFLKVTTKGKSRLPYDLLLYHDLNNNGTFEDDEGPEDRQCPDIFENNDSETDTASVASGTYTDLQMCVPSPTAGPDEDWYDVFVPKGATITADATFKHADGNIDMRLYRKTSSGKNRVDTSLSTSDNESVTKKNSSSGSKYLIQVTGSTQSTLGFRNDYDLKVSLSFPGSCPEDSFGTSGSGNFSKSNAASISVKDYDMSNGLMLCENTVDWFKFSPGSSGTATFGLEHTATLGELQIQILDGSGSQLGTVNTMYNGNVKVASYSGLSSGSTYYVRVRPAKTGGVRPVVRNPYDLWASWSGNTPSEPWCPDPYERNDDRSNDDSYQLSKRSGSALLGGSLACGTEKDWYRVDLSGGTTYNYDVFFTHSSSSDLDTKVVDSSGSVVNGINFGSHSSTDDELNSFTPSSSGTYFVGVQNTKVGEAPYQLQVVQSTAYTNLGDCPDVSSREPNDSTFTATSLPSGSGTHNDALCASSGSGETDVFTVKSDNGGSMTVELVFDSTNGNLGGYFLDPNNNRTDLTGSGNHYDASISGLNAGDQLEIHVGGPAGAKSPYFLRVTD